MGLESPTPLSGLGSTKSTHRLNQIDKVQANDIGNLISLPQIAVFGDQSSGKSSVLERVTGIPFPREEGLCTRFPTEIILRHNSEPLKLLASIRPHVSRTDAEKKRIRAYRHALTDMSELPGVIEESAALMGIRGYGPGPHTGDAFAHDTLRIEISGPVGLHLTIVDLPGLISVPNEEQTEEDVRMVTAIVERYMKSTRTIIMAVVQASNDVANQRVIQLARKHDTDGDRTIGIITKPDLINAGTEHRIAQLAKNRDSVKLKLGFFLVKNPSPSENETADGAAQPWDESAQRERAFFNEPAWRKQNLAAERVGIDALRLYLQEKLNRHIEQELPKVRGEIKRQLADKKEELAAMGVKRQSCSDVRLFLTTVSMRFHGLAEAALDGNYTGMKTEFFEAPGTRLRAVVHGINEQFAKAIRLRGQRRKISEINGPEKPPQKRTVLDKDEDEIERKLSVLFEKDTEEPTDETEGQLLVTKEEMTAWVHEIYKTTRGRELPGSHNHVLLAQLFREQSSLWPSLAISHIQTVLDTVTQWAAQAAKACATEENIRQEIFALCQDPMEKVRSASLDELQKLIDDEKRHPITYNHYYTDNIQHSRMKNQEAAVAKAIASVGNRDRFGNPASSVDTVGLLKALGDSTAVEVDMTERACKEALDELEAYYKVAMKTFVDNVCRQVVERHIMTVLPMLFSPNMVATFSDEELLRIGSETEAQQTKRAELETLVSGLRQSLIDLQAHA